MKVVHRHGSIANIHLASSLFCDRRYAFSEAMVMHLKSLGLTYHEIALLISRDDRTIWTIYQRALIKSQKAPAPFLVKKDMLIPTTVFKDRSISIMEALVEYLKEKRQMTYHKIAELLNRNDRTIWTIYKRTAEKRKNRGIYHVKATF